MNILKSPLAILALAGALLGSSSSFAADYDIDIKGTHAFINFKIQHLGYSWLTGRFNKFGGEFSYDKDNLAASKIKVDIDVTSIDSNHAERDKHLRGGDFLDTAKFPDASFVSTKFVEKSDGTFDIIGDLTLHGTTKSVTINAKKIGEGKDPWGGYRAGFEGTITLRPADFGISYNLGPASATLELELLIEGIKQ